MSRPFSNSSAKSSFAQVNETLDASSYTNKKALKSIFYQCSNTRVDFDKTQLYTNLYTKLDLSELNGVTPIISDLSGNTFPVIIDKSVAPYLKYNIDPSGALFGNDTCGINNYLNYVTCDVSSI
jgi:hypothetical protein